MTILLKDVCYSTDSILFFLFLNFLLPSAGASAAAAGDSSVAGAAANIRS